LISCQKDDLKIITLSTIDNVAISNSQGICTPNNSNNDFDTIGIIHNRILGEFSDHINLRDSVSGIFDAMDSILVSEFGTWVQTYLLDSSDVASYFDEIESDTLKSFISNLSTTSTDKYYMTELVEILAEFDGTNACDIIDNIIHLETLLLASYDEEDLPGTFAMASAGRYSAYYWENNSFLEIRKWNWKKFWMVVGDAVGAGAGFAVGSAGTPLLIWKGIGYAIITAGPVSKWSGDLYDKFTED